VPSAVSLRTPASREPLAETDRTLYGAAGYSADVWARDPVLAHLREGVARAQLATHESLALALRSALGADEVLATVTTEPSLARDTQLPRPLSASAHSVAWRSLDAGPLTPPVCLLLLALLHTHAHACVYLHRILFGLGVAHMLGDGPAVALHRSTLRRLVDAWLPVVQSVRLWGEHVAAAPSAGAPAGVLPSAFEAAHQLLQRWDAARTDGGGAAAVAPSAPPPPPPALEEALDWRRSKDALQLALAVARGGPGTLFVLSSAPSAAPGPRGRGDAAAVALLQHMSRFEFVAPPERRLRVVEVDL
jgi:hypothetical protein